MSHLISLAGVKWSCLRIIKPAFPPCAQVLDSHVQSVLVAERARGGAEADPGGKSSSRLKLLKIQGPRKIICCVPRCKSWIDSGPGRWEADPAKCKVVIFDEIGVIVDQVSQT